VRAFAEVNTTVFCGNLASKCASEEGSAGESVARDLIRGASNDRGTLHRNP
jgi:hypothetical protein